MYVCVYLYKYIYKSFTALARLIHQNSNLRLKKPSKEERRKERKKEFEINKRFQYVIKNNLRVLGIDIRDGKQMTVNGYQLKRKWSTKVVQRLKHEESNTQAWNVHFGSRTYSQFLTLYNLKMFVTSVVVSVRPNLDLQVILDLTTTNYRTLVLQKSFCSNLLVTRVNTVCGSVVGLRGHIRVYVGNINWKIQLIHLSRMRLSLLKYTCSSEDSHALPQVLIVNEEMVLYKEVDVTIYIYIYECVCVCVSVCTCMYEWVYIYIYIYI